MRRLLLLVALGLFLPAAARAQDQTWNACGALASTQSKTNEVGSGDCIQYEFDETGKLVEYKLWGKNNSPQRTFASWEEMRDYAGVRVRGSNPRKWLWTGACAAVLTLLVALALRHRFKTRRQA